MVASSVHNENAKFRKFQRLIQVARVSNWSRFADKCWRLPPGFLLFSSSFPKSACPTQAIRCLWCFSRFSKLFSNLKTWGRTWQCVPMTDFYRKVNKFFQKFVKCEPCLTEVILVGWFGKCQSIKKVGGRRFIEGLYQDLFSFRHARRNVIFKAQRK